MDIDLADRAARPGSRRQRRLPARPLAEPGGDRQRRSPKRFDEEMFRAHVRRRLRGRRALERARPFPTATSTPGIPARRTSAGRRTSTACRSSRSRSPTSAARAASSWSATRVTTDHISPAGAIRPDSPAGRYLIDHGVERNGLQLLRLAPRESRGDGARHVRERPPAQPARAGHRGLGHRPPSGRRADVDLRRLAALPGRGRAARRRSPARSTARAPPGTGRPRGRPCSASGP